MLECGKRASGIKCCVFLAAMEALPVVRCVQLAAERWFQEEVQGLRTVVSLPKLDNERGIRHQEDVSLVHHTLLHACLNDVSLAQGLHGVSLIRMSVHPELHGAETSTAQKADLYEVLPADFSVWDVIGIRFGLVVADEARAAGAIGAALDDVLERAQQQVECVTIQCQRFRSFGNDPDGCSAWLAVQQRALSKEFGLVAGLAAGELCLNVSILDDFHLALVKNVKSVPDLTLLQNHLALREMHLHQRLRQRLFLVGQQRRQDFHLI
mmetsp:Transcript_2952/g.7535  ORF Transcript_2952/g.7535 Transcript_2952/m.7535 type:complete len:267 (+) Transcript_2952:958-1758(+)